MNIDDAGVRMSDSLKVKVYMHAISNVWIADEDLRVKITALSTYLGYLISQKSEDPIETFDRTYEFIKAIIDESSQNAK